MPIKGAATLSQVTSISIECADCGRLRWRRPAEFYKRGSIGPATTIGELGSRLACAECQSAGDQGKNIVLQAAFAFEGDRIRAEAAYLRSLEVPVSGSRATGS
jgi:hypothetical protein